MGNGNSEMRFSDQQLTQFRQEFGDYKIEQENRWRQVVEMVQQNTAATASLTESTRGIIQLYSDVHGVIRVGAGVQKFCIWVAKWGIVGSAIATAVMYIANHWGS